MSHIAKADTHSSESLTEANSLKWHFMKHANLIIMLVSHAPKLDAQSHNSTLGFIDLVREQGLFKEIAFFKNFQ